MSAVKLLNLFQALALHLGCALLQRVTIPLLCLLALTLHPAPGHGAERPFAQRFVTNVKGDIHVIGNTLLSCNSASSGCTDARNGIGGSLDNSKWTMAYVNVDGRPQSSSSAELSLPNGSTVLWAGLYWAGNRPNNNTTYPNIKMKTPASGGYISLTAQTNDLNIGNQNNAYLCFTDVTSYVLTGGAGTYTVADIVVNPNPGGNSDGYAGWGLIVVFENESMPLRNLTVFDGFSYIGNNSGITANLTGFTTPLNGPVGTTVGFLAGNGRLGANGDGLALSGTSLSDPLRPYDNFINARATNLGTYSPRNPSYNNLLGWDVGRVNASGILGNNTSNASIVFSGNSDKYFPYAFSFATEIYVPIIAPNIIKTGTDINGGLLVPGDILRYEISLSNTGFDTGTNVVLSDPIPAHTTFVPGSLRVMTGANTGVKSDSAGNDQAEYCTPVTSPSCPVPQVIFRLGSGATSTNGGNIPYLASTSISFDVVLNPTIPSGTVLTNQASISYSGQTLGASFAATSSLAAVSVYTPPAATKSFSPNPIDVGGVSTMTIQLTNSGPNQTTVTGVSFNDIYPPGLFNTATPSPSLLCSAGASATLIGGIPGGNSIGISGGIFPPNASCTLTVSVTSSLANNYVNLTSDISSDNTGSVPGASATLSVGKQLISTSFVPNRILINDSSEATFTITNPTVIPLSGLTFSDALSGLQIASGASTNNCGGTLNATAGSTLIELHDGDLAASSSCTITVPVTTALGGYYANTTGPVNATDSPGIASNTAYLTVVAPPVAAMTFTPPSVSPGASSSLNITITNPNSTAAIGGVSFTDNFPSGIIHAAAPNPTLTCSGGTTATLNSTATSIGISAGNFAPGGSCTVKVNITANTVNNYNNFTGPITTTNGGIGLAANATFNISSLTPPGASVSFSPASLPRGQSSTMTVTLNNSNGLAINGAGFTIPYPAGLINAVGPNPQTTCGGTTTAIADGNSLIFIGGVIPANGSCTVSVAVTAANGGTYFVNTGTITTTNAAVGAGASGNIKFVAPPLIAKTFLINPVGVTPAFSTLQITLTNPGVNSETLTGIGFSDIFPAGLIVAGTPAPGNTCGGSLNGTTAGSTSLSLSNASLAANSNCSISVNVTAASAGNYVNTTSPVTSNNGGTGLTASATLSVGRPGISMAFSPASILYGNTSTLTFTLSNPTDADMTGATYTNSYPASLTNATPLNATTTCSGGIVTAIAGGSSIALTGGTIPGSGSKTCTVTVLVRGTASMTNSIPTGALTITGGASNANEATAFLNVTQPPSVTKSFAPVAIPLGATSTMTIVITNPTATAMTGVSLTDSYPGNGALKNSAPAGMVCTAGTSATLTGGAINGTSVGISNGSIGANGNCTITVPVIPTAVGTYNNSTGPVDWSIGGIPGGAAPGGSSTLTVLHPFTFAKSFIPATISVYGQSLLTITLSNPNITPVTGVSFTDTYNANIVNATPSGGSSSCGGIVTAISGSNILSLAGGTIPAASSGNPGTCQVTAYVTSSTVSTAPGWVNTLNSVSSTNAGTTATPASDWLSVVRLQAPMVSKVFSPDILQAGMNTRMTVSITNPNTLPILVANFTDTYPVQIQNSSLPAAATTCPGGTATAISNGGTLSLSNATIPAGGSCNVTVNVTSSVIGTWTNTLSTVSSANADPASQTSADLAVILRYLEIIKTVNTTTPLEGSVVDFTITLTNHSPNAMTGIEVTDILPAELLYQSDNGGGAYVPATGIWSAGDLPAGGSKSLTMTAQVKCGTFGGTYINQAAVSARTPTDPNPASNNATAAVTPTAAEPGLIVVKSASHSVNGDPIATAVPGQIITYTVQVQNSGCGKASKVVLNDQLSPYTAWQLDYDNQSPLNEPFSFSPGASGLSFDITNLDFSRDHGINWGETPISENGGMPAGYDGTITNWKIEMGGKMAPGENFILRYRTKVK